MNKSIQAGIEKLEELDSSTGAVEVSFVELRFILTAMLTEEKEPVDYDYIHNFESQVSKSLQELSDRLSRLEAMLEDDDFLVGKPVTSDDFPECKSNPDGLDYLREAYCERPAVECAHEYSDWSKKCIKCDEPKPLPSSELGECKHDWIRMRNLDGSISLLNRCYKCGEQGKVSETTISIDRRVAEEWIGAIMSISMKSAEDIALEKELRKALSL
jgi:hypothetical protein